MRGKMAFGSWLSSVEGNPSGAGLNDNPGMERLISWNLVTPTRTLSTIGALIVRTQSTTPV